MEQPVYPDCEFHCRGNTGTAKPPASRTAAAAILLQGIGVPLTNAEAELVIEGNTEVAVISHSQQFPDIDRSSPFEAQQRATPKSLTNYMARLQNWPGCKTACTNGQIIGIQFQPGAIGTDDLPVVFAKLAALY